MPTSPEGAALLNVRKQARAIITAAFISSLRNVEDLKQDSETGSASSIENGKSRRKIKSKNQKICRPKMVQVQTETDPSWDLPKINSQVSVSFPKLKNSDFETENDAMTEKSVEKTWPARKPWNPLTDGKKAIIVMIDKVWSVPYAPSQYVVQFMCTVSLCRMQRHKYCVRWQNGRRSAIFYVNIDEDEKATNVWVNFPGEIKAHRPHNSHLHFQKFLQRNLF